MKFKFIDLFAGVGGFRMALQNLDGHCVFSSEWNQHAKETYFHNYGEYPEGDITLNETKAKIPESFDILCGGFPCQAFSIAGNQKGFNETRGTLFFEIVDIAKKHQPRVIFLENVKNLVSHDKGNTFEVIKNTLKEIGYAVYFQVLNSMTHANVPQNRERIFIVAFNEALVPNHADFQFPEAIPLTKTIHDFLETEQVDQKYYYQPDHKYYPALDAAIQSRDTVYQWRRKYVRENKSNVCPTLTANMGAGGHNVPLICDAFGIRKLTPKECFAFQGYPVNVLKMPEIADSHLYMQAGNSVTMPLIQRIGEQILKVLIKNLKKGGVMDIQKVKVKAQIRWWEDTTVNGIEDTENGANVPCKQGELWCPIINVATGIIENWEIGKTAKIHYKVTDGCGWELLDKNGIVIQSQADGYVPETLCPAENGYGDYIIMNINEKGLIDKWHFDIDDFHEDDQ